MIYTPKVTILKVETSKESQSGIFLTRLGLFTRFSPVASTC